MGGRVGGKKVQVKTCFLKTESEEQRREGLDRSEHRGGGWSKEETFMEGGERRRKVRCWYCSATGTTSFIQKFHWDSRKEHNMNKMAGGQPGLISM